jgi:hypothetical protein
MLNTNTKTITNNINIRIRHTEMALLAGFILATSIPLPVQAAAMIKMAEINLKPGHINKHEREEPSPHYSSFGSMQRTPARSGTF